MHRGCMTVAHTCGIFTLFTLFKFASASVNTIEAHQGLTGNCPSEAYNPLAAPADVPVPYDLIWQRWLLSVQQVSASTPS